MTPEEFVREFWLLKKQYLNSVEKAQMPHFNSLLKQLNLTEEHRQTSQKILDTALTDVLYTVLLGLDGEAQIGEKQLTYSVADEQVNQLCRPNGGGEVEGFAYKYFHDGRYKKPRRHNADGAFSKWLSG